MLLAFGQSMAMMKEILDCDFASIYFDKTSHSIIAVWKKPTYSESFRTIHSFILKKIRYYHTDSFICDIFYQGLIAKDNRLWLQTKALPEAHAAGLRKVGIVAPNDVFSRFYIEILKNSPASVVAEMEVRYFHDLMSAQTWLTNQNSST